MPKRAALKPVRIKDRNRPWKLEIPGRYSITGKRQRFFFETKADADREAEDQRVNILNFGAKGSTIFSPLQTEQAKAAFEALKPFGVQLNEVVKDWISRRNAREATVTFLVAGESYKAHLEKKKIRGRPVSDAYQATTRQTLARFDALDNTPLSDIDATKLAQLCEPLTPSVKNTSLAVLSAFFSWCMQTPRHWIASNPATTVPRESTGGSEVETFSNADVLKVLSACAGEMDLLAFHAIGFFAGIRPEELERVEWKFVNLDEKVIVLPASNDAGKRVTKTGKRRVIEITDTLETWLQWIITKAGIRRGHLVSTVNLRRRLRAVREAAGVDWIQDGMRHTYASNWLATYENEHRLRDNLGHRSASELWDHYHKATTKKDARGFWDILPEHLKVVPFEQGKAA